MIAAVVSASVAVKANCSIAILIQSDTILYALLIGLQLLIDNENDNDH